jgi:hypothetical protein
MSEDIDDFISGLLSSSRPSKSQRSGIRGIRSADERAVKTRRYRTAGMSKIGLPTALDDPQFFKAGMENKDSVIFGAYGVDDWLSSTFLQQSIRDGITTIMKSGTWIIPANWDFVTWCATISPRYNFISANRAMIFTNWGQIEVGLGRQKIEVEINGKIKEVNQFIDLLHTQFKQAENLIEWVYGQRGESISVPLNYRPAINEAYPWINGGLDAYIDAYMNSDASVLILIGAPGTGKTTFVKNLIHRSGADAKVTYDVNVMQSDGIFASFIEGREKFMIMEDADAFLKSRADGNTMMHRFLNVSDGLISASNKKLVFSTNLPSVRDIDDALMRPGRCFDVMEFRPLTRDEAIAVCDKTGRPHPGDGSSFTLASLFGDSPNTSKVKTKKVGFV